MNMPGMVGEASVYKTNNHYRSSAIGRLIIHKNVDVVPQQCDWLFKIACGPVIAGGLAACGTTCAAAWEAGGPLGGYPCYLCLMAYDSFVGGGFNYCKECLPAWIRAIIDFFENGGGGGDSGGPLHDCTTTGCPSGLVCCDCRTPAFCTTQAGCQRYCSHGEGSM
jgi:hypothetical protein